MFLKIVESVIWVSNSLDPGETPSFGVSSGSNLFAYGTKVSSSGLRVKYKQVSRDNYGSIIIHLRSFMYYIVPQNISTNPILQEFDTHVCLTQNPF